MIKDIFTDEICRAFGFTPTSEQAAAIDVFSSFATCRDEQSAMILRGSAGTGKTSLAGAIVRAMKSLHQNVVLMAPQGVPQRCSRSMPDARHTPFITAYIAERHTWARIPVSH